MRPTLGNGAEKVPRQVRDQGQFSRVSVGKSYVACFKEYSNHAQIHRLSREWLENEASIFLLWEDFLTTPTRGRPDAGSCEKWLHRQAFPRLSTNPRVEAADI